MTFHHGEEVLVDGERFVIWGVEGERFRLLASTPSGPKVRWAVRSELNKIAAYTKPRDDTDEFVRFRKS
jgi:hypothetical protein